MSKCLVIDHGIFTAFAERLASGPTLAIKWTKASVNIGLKQLAHSIMDASLRCSIHSTGGSLSASAGALRIEAEGES